MQGICSLLAEGKIGLNNKGPDPLSPRKSAYNRRHKDEREQRNQVAARKFKQLDLHG
jgi:hypothetical protein